MAAAGNAATSSIATGFGQYAGHVGCVIVALNFRQGADAYPSSLVDINYGIRWVKANASAGIP